MAGVFLCDRIIADAPGAFAYSPRLCGLDTRPRAHLSPTRVDILFIRYITEYFPCEFFSMAEECRRPVHRGRLRRRARVGAGCGVLRAWLVTTPREAPETEPSATTSGREELADGEASLASSRAGPEPTIAAVERREASVPAGTQGARWRLRAYVTGPPTGAAAPERLSALRFPHVV